MRAARHVGIEKDRAKAHRLCAQGGGGADAAQAENAEGLRAQAAHLGGGFDFPTEAFGLRVEREELAVEREREGDSVVGDFLGAVVGHIAHRNAGPRRRREVHAVKTHAVPHDRPAAGHARHHLRRHPWSVPQDDGVGPEHLGREWCVEVERVPSGHTRFGDG